MNYFLSILMGIFLFQKSLFGMNHQPYAKKLSCCQSIEQIVCNCNRHDVDEIVATYVFIVESLRTCGFDLESEDVKIQLERICDDLLDITICGRAVISSSIMKMRECGCYVPDTINVERYRK